MKKILKSIVAILCAFVMFGTAQSVSADTQTTTSQNMSFSKSATSTSNPGEYKIDFDLPAGEGKVNTNADVVILMDKTSVHDLPGLKTATSALIDQMLTKGAADGVNFKVGVVWFNFDVQNGTNGLVDLTSTSAPTIKNAIVDGGGPGSNFTGGVRRAKKWLDDDTTVADSNKFLIVAGDMTGYTADDGNGKALIRYNDEANGYVGNGDFWKYTQAQLASVNSTTIANLIDNKICINGVASDPKWLTTDGASVGEYGINDSRVGNTVTMTDYNATNCPTSFEKSIYQTGNMFKEMKTSGYNLVAVNKHYYAPGNGKDIYNTTNLGYQKWFKENIGSQYDLDAGDTIDYAFNDISNSVFELLGKGQLVDTIGDDFVLSNNGSTTNAVDSIQVTYDGSKLTRATLAPNKFGFGTPNSGVYPYVATYNATAKTITWDINVPTKRYHSLQLSHNQLYTGTQKNVDVQTNKGPAVLNYMSSLDVANNVANWTASLSVNSPTVHIAGGPVVATTFKIDTTVVNGTIDKSKDDVNSGDNVTINFKGKAGYVLDYIEVDNTKITISGKETSYTFNNVTANHSIKVVYKQTTVNGGNNPSNKGVVNTGDASNVLVLVSLLMIGGLITVISKKRLSK